MKRALFLVASLTYGFTSYAEASEKPVRTGPRSQVGRVGHDVVRVFQNANSPAFCMGVAGGSTKPRASIKQGNCTFRGKTLLADQYWILEPVGNTIYYHIRNGKNRNMCLGVDRGSRAPRADIRLGTCNGNADQKWSLPSPPGKPNDDPATVSIRNAHNLCIGVAGASTSRAQLKQNNCTGAHDQTWIMWWVGDGPVG